MWPNIPLLQRYIFREILRVFTFVLGCITVLLVFVGIFQQATDSGLDPQQALTIIPYVVPSMLPFTIPAALLLTVSVVYGRISGDQEVTAAKSAGIHPLSLMWPAMFLGAVLSLCSLILTDQVIPWSMGKIEQHIVSFMEDIFLDRLRTEHHFSDPRRGLLVTVEGVEGQRLLHPTFRYTKGQKICTLQAEEAEIDLDVEGQRVNIHALNAWVDIPGGTRGRFAEVTEQLRWNHAGKGPKAQQLPILRMKQELVEIDQERDLKKQYAVLHACFALTMADFPRLATNCGQRLADIDQRQGWAYRLNAEVHSRYAMSCSCFFFALLGTPFAMRYGKSQALTSFLICFVPIVGAYYPLMLGLTTQCKQGKLDPEWSMWVANGVLVVLAWSVLRKVIRY
ncbi:LptF/LptG family permease [Planctomicrobium piriforme]|uniref:Lipopolysaccharide export system permease protein n=1 Tax=Planctomicrobium piriforme TaxID=1576369 RepID=A0A1I3Q1X3_9PLAN|nr:LptF/LptG family permease [Planctomicrobium piriforme]SFJ27709.1 lipopolysaccharide export system permease protein [Planctomicrobium piriforme]